MQIGVVFPQTEIGNDPSAIRDYAQTAEGLGFSHVLAYDHVLGANPQRPGVGLGWNEVEYTSLNENFHNRGKRIEEQVELMRKLWTDPLVNFKGKWHTIPDAGLNPLPVQRPIPVWFGGSAEPALRRLARLGNGWIVLSRSAAEAKPALAMLERFLEQAGRTRSQVGLEARISYDSGDPKAWETALREWQEAGATHLSFNTMGKGFKTPQEHIQAIQKFAAAVL
jgi:alkanesulfonate monooxygenase SsuD/methylene tetrahydromethanopterin reductase-like flavin-dependent oxidoreductase (luciferase family)